MAITMRAANSRTSSVWVQSSLIVYGFNDLAHVNVVHQQKCWCIVILVKTCWHNMMHWSTSGSATRLPADSETRGQHDLASRAQGQQLGDRQNRQLRTPSLQNATSQRSHRYCHAPTAWCVPATAGFLEGHLVTFYREQSAEVFSETVSPECLQKLNAMSRAHPRAEFQSTAWPILSETTPRPLVSARPSCAGDPLLSWPRAPWLVQSCTTQLWMASQLVCLHLCCLEVLHRLPGQKPELPSQWAGYVGGHRGVNFKDETACDHRYARPEGGNLNCWIAHTWSCWIAEKCWIAGRCWIGVCSWCIAHMISGYLWLLMLNQQHEIDGQL